MFELKFLPKFCWLFNHTALNFVLWTFEFV